MNDDDEIPAGPLSLEGLRQSRRLSSQEGDAVWEDIERTKRLLILMQWDVLRPETTIAALIMQLVGIETRAREIRETLQAKLITEG